LPSRRDSVAFQVTASTPLCPQSARVAEIGLKLVVIGGSALLAFLAWRSLGWPLPPDASAQHYIAWLVDEGFVPYRDVFDPNVPGVYLLHLVALGVVGPGDLGFRLWELGWLAAIVVLLVVYCRPLAGRWGAVAAALLFALYHLGGGMKHAGEREFFLCLLLLVGALGTARWLEQPTRHGSLMIAGLALGAGMTVKPFAGLFWAGCLVAVVVSAWRQGRTPWTPVTLLGGGALVAPALTVAWLVATDGLGPFVAQLTGYVMPLFSKIARNRFGRFFMSYWASTATLVAVASVIPVAPSFAARRWLAAFGVGYGVLHVALQFKGSWYHFHPFALFMFALAAPALAPARRDPTSWASVARALRLPVALVLVAVAMVQVAKREPASFAREPRRLRERAERVHAAAADLRRAVLPGRTAQVMDVVEGGGLHAMLLARVHPATRFVTDSQFFHHEDDPRIRALRAEFIEALTTRPPAAIMIFPVRWRKQEYRRLERFPELLAVLDRHYTLSREGPGYRLYTERPP
jgi:hypothetical protein